MLSRLARAIDAMDDALGSYQFARCAEIAYDLLWRDFCDWYLEAIKPTIATSPAQRAVLGHTLDAMLRLLHPLVPFVTETIYERLPQIDRPGLDLAPSTHDDLLCCAPWPRMDPSWICEQAESDFAEFQTLVRAISDVRSQQKVHPRRKITLHVDGQTADRIRAIEGIVRTIAGIGTIVSDAPPSGAVPIRFQNRELHLSDLADALDPDAERAHIAVQIADLESSLVNLDKRLSNPGYAQKAPAHLVQQTRDQRAKAEDDLRALHARLEELA